MRAGLRLHLRPAVLTMHLQRLVIANTQSPLERPWWKPTKAVALLHEEDQAHVQAVTRVLSALEETRPLTQASEGGDREV